MDRFWDKVSVLHPFGCWIWLASTNTGPRGGYGQFWFNGTNVKAHKFAYELLIGPVPQGMVLDHLCRNRSCVNPDHLEIVTELENRKRGSGRIGRLYNLK